MLTVQKKHNITYSMTQENIYIYGLTNNNNSGDSITCQYTH